ncbi:MAG: putative bifunctional diguanylate cyclase/phosphodiesterase [Solirubrobacteraceae bacterium]
MVFAILAALLLAYLGFLIARPASDSSTLIDGWGVAAFNVLAACLCIARGLTRRSGRLVPLTLGFSLLSWGLGDLALTIESLGGATPPTPSLADAFYLAFFPLAYVGIVLFIRGEVQRLSTPSWLDSAIAALGAAAVCATFAFHSLLHTAGGDGLEVATNLAYPVGDLLLLALVVGSAAMLAGRSRAPWILLATGMAVNAVGDTFNLFGSGIGATHLGVTVDGIAWPTAILLVSMAMWVPRGHANPLMLQKPTGFVLPGLAAISSLAILIFAAFNHPGTVAVALAAATLVVVGIRLTLSVRGLRSLTQERQHQSVTDHLTGLGNRRFLFGVLDGFFADHADSSVRTRRMAFLYIDLNRFKEINDSFGHPAGDELLRQLGERFRAPLRSTDALVRLGGDEFAAVLMDVDADDATTIAKQLHASLDQPFALDSVSVRIGASIGIATAPADATDGDGLVACADVAMYRAKIRGEAFALYQQDFDDAGSLLRLAEELRHAVADGELALYFQPQLELQTGETRGVEALLRWPHPRLGVVPPLKFLPLAEQAGLMRGLTRWVLDQALAQCAAWRSEAELTVSVNISATDLIDADFAGSVRDLLDRHALPAEALVLEITETSLIAEFDRARVAVDELNDIGVVVSIDDFGTGFTSLAYLSELTVGELKLDRTFISRLANDGKGRDVQLVRSTIDLGHALGMRVVGEGIEDQATLELLRSLGCDVAQGYSVGRPEPAEALKLGAGRLSHARPSIPASGLPDGRARRALAQRQRAGTRT